MPETEKRDRRRRRIILVARDLLAAEGVAEFTLDAVAEALELTKPAIYYYFPSKEALIRSAMEAGGLQHADALFAAVLEVSGDEVLEVLARTFVEQYAEHLEHFRLDFVWPQLFGLPAPKDDVVTPKMVELNDLVEDRLAQSGIGRSPKHRRRLGLLAWTSALGLLSALSLTEDGLRPRTSVLVDDMAEMLRSTTAAAKKKKRKPRRRAS